MKLDRLLAITTLLLNRSRVSARELSEHFEVSVRTIHRDMEAINQAGIPIVAYPGANGGFGIMENYKFDRHVLTSDEMYSIITALRGVSTTIDDRKLTDTLEKIKGLIPHNELEKIRKKSEEIIIDFNPWGASKKDKEKFNIIKRAVDERKVIGFSYTNAKGEYVDRTVEPLSMIFKGNFWYLLGFCRLKDDFRIFRLSRMKNLSVSSENFIRRSIPADDSNLDVNWERTAPPVNLVLRFAPRVRVRVEDSFHEDNIRYEDDGTLTVRVTYPEDDWVYSTILSYGDEVEVLEPGYLRGIIREKALRMAALYKKD